MAKKSRPKATTKYARIDPPAKYDDVTEPLPIEHHEEFKRLMSELSQVAQRMRARWLMASRRRPCPEVDKHLDYWRAVNKGLRWVEWVGTRNGNSR